ncbi:MAG: CvpA family protein [Bacilli bacterium]
MKIIEIAILIIILLGALMGFQKGAIKGIFELVGTVSIIIIAYLLKGYLTTVLIKYLPFFNFKGYVGLYSINFMIYDVISFIIIFVLLYCILNILINLAGFIDKLINLSVIFALPSKIIGLVFGMVNALIFVFLLCYIAMQIPHTQKYVMESSVSTKILERTPIVNVVCSKGILVGEDVYNKLSTYSFNEEDIQNMNLQIATSVAKYGLVDKKFIQEAINAGKLNLDHVIIA